MTIHESGSPGGQETGRPSGHDTGRPSGRLARVLRVGLVILVLPNAQVAAWTLLAPRSFYDDFPAEGRHWVSSLGPYNEHLLRDFGAASLGFVVLLVAAAVLLERRLVQVALLATLTANLPHFAYHLTTLDEFDTENGLGQVAAFTVTSAIALVLLVLVGRRAPAREPPARPG